VPSRSRRPAHAPGGFTLLEVLVALLLLSLAMVALVRSAGLEARAQVQQREATLAQWVAANVIAETRLARRLPSSGQSQGRAEMGEQRWRWQLDVRPTEEAGLIRLEVRVYVEGGEVAFPAATLNGFYAP